MRVRPNSPAPNASPPARPPPPPAGSATSKRPPRTCRVRMSHGRNRHVRSGSWHRPEPSTPAVSLALRSPLRRLRQADPLRASPSTPHVGLDVSPRWHPLLRDLLRRLLDISPLMSLCSTPECPTPPRAGRQRYCRACHNAWMRAHRPRHAALTTLQRFKANARRYAGVYQSRGHLIPQPCTSCGASPAEKHHPDYAQPLNVTWLCRLCHLALHRHASTSL